MEPELELPCQTVVFLKIPEEIARKNMKGMPSLNINYDVSKIIGIFSYLITVPHKKI